MSRVERYTDEGVFLRLRSNSDALRMDSVGWLGLVMHSVKRLNASPFSEKTPGEESLADFFAAVFLATVRVARSEK
jgi:hypothetical protein